MINYVANEKTVTFQIPLGIPKKTSNKSVVSIPVSEKDVDIGAVYLVQKKGRTLPVPAATFANQLAETLTRDFDVVYAN